MDVEARIAPAQADWSIPELLQKLAADTTQLVRQEIQLAQAEIGQKARAAGRSLPLLAVTAVLVVGAFGTLTTTFVLALGEVMAGWAAALVVTAVYAIVAAVTAKVGIDALKKAGAPVPDQTIETIREDVEAVRAGVQRGR
jgi:uncharacterized membrane protein YqjE